MALLGQASGGFTESSSSLRILHVGIRNTVGVLCEDAFTQSNPPVEAANISDQVDTSTLGVLSGSVAFTRADGGRCLLYTSPSPRDGLLSRMPSSA